MLSNGVVSVEKWLGARRADAAPRGRLAPGARIGEWRVSAFLGAGLSAEVYRVTNVRFVQEGALKLLVDDTRGLKERFFTEADAIRFLSLRALPRYMGSGEYDGMPFYVMEYLQPLPCPMPRGEVAGFMNRVAKAVQQLHDAGYIHRDLKPGNILRRENGEPVLIDLGLIKRRGTGVTDPVVRHGRGVSIIDGKPVGVGTLDYAAPEQLLKGEATVQSDVFALGKILRGMYDGRPPGNVKPIIRRATRELPEDRYGSANEFAAALRHRNYSRVAWALLLLAGLVATALFPVMRPGVVKFARSVLNPQDRVRALTQLSDESEAAYFKRMMRLAETGDPQAKIEVAEAYFYGRGVGTNRDVAVKWYRSAATDGEADAQASLGYCLFHGHGCEKDAAEAVKWWALAAEKGSLNAMNDLAYGYMNGLGVKRDEEKGFQLALQAAELGYAPAQAMVGECYRIGRGVEKNPDRGETWLYRAARKGNKRAKKILTER